MRALLAKTTFGCIAAAAVAWPGPAPAQDASRLETPQFRSTVQLVQLQVNVAGPDGAFVPGLEPGDFLLRVNGEDRPVQVVYEVNLDRPADSTAEETTAPALDDAPPAAARRHFLFLFDLSFTSRRGILEARRSALDFVDSRVHPRDFVAVATYGRFGFRLLAPFTGEHAQAREAIATLGLADAGDALASGIDFEESISQALSELAEGPAGDDGGIGAMLAGSEFSTYVGEVANYAEQMAELGALLQAVEGRKHVVLFSRGFDDRALTGQSLGELAAGAEARAASPAGVAGADAEQMYGSAEVRRALERMIDEFREADAVVHAVDPTGLRQGDNDVTRQVSPIATSAFGGGGDLATGNLRNGHQALVAMAEGTGGTISWGLNDLSVALERIEEATAAFYMIGYRRSPDDPATVEVEVSVRAPDVRVVSAPTRLAPPPPFGEMTEAQRQLQLAEFFADSIDRRDLSFETQVVPFPQVSADGKLAVLLEIPGLEIDRLARERGDDRVQLEFAALARDAGGAAAAVVRRGLTVDVARMRDAGSMVEQSVRLADYLQVPPGDYRVRMLLREREVGRLSTRTVGAHLPEPVGDALRVARPLILSPSSAPARPEGDAPFDPLSLDGRQVMAAASPVLAPGESFLALVVIYNLPRDPATGEPRAGVVLEIDGGERSLPVTDFEIIGSRYEGDSGITQLVIQGILPTDAPTGTASLWARLLDATSGRRIEEQAPVFVTAPR